ncbi:bifunctional DNA primase/polymerase [Methylobacterium sp. ID0610]|uniref:bifunctional DNA primase/polymerase n=1 Tax=Methylobacterium carpenticola TaxID=3344827 RepID=UPI0036AEAACB
MSNAPQIQAILARFPGAQIVTDTVPPAGALPVVGGMHQINAPCFSVLAPELVTRGWSVFPQTRDGKRGSGLVDNAPLKWKPYQDRLPTLAEVDWWSRFCPSHNIACILGDASGGTWALDVDVSDGVLSEAIVALADEHLGYTPFRRVGRVPRIVLVYRQAPASEAGADNVIRVSPPRFAARAGEDSPGQIEVLGHGKPVTFFGLHHGTGKYFIWVDGSPHVLGPEHAPLVTRQQYDAFLDAVNEIRPFARRAVHEAPDAAWQFDPAAGLHRPTALGEPDWQTSEGKVVDGRKKFLFRLVSTTVRANESAARDPGTGRAQLCALVEQEFLARAELGGKWTPLAVKTEIRAMVASSCDWHIREERFSRVRPGAPIAVDGEGEVEHAPSRTDDLPPAEVPPELAHIRSDFARLLARTGRKGYTLKAGPHPVRALKRALLTDELLRTQAAQAATAQVRSHQDRWIDRLYERAAERRSRELRKDKTALDAGLISILRGDAGVGKTSTFWRAFARAKDRHGPLGYPVGFAMPTHANIEDSLEGAIAARLAWEQSVAEAVEAGEKAGLKVVVFRGKLRTNCAFKPQLRALNEASIRADGLCKSKVNVNEKIPGAEPEWEERLCPMFEACEYQRTLAEVATADIVLFASAYLSAKAPAALTKALLALVVDERPYSALLGTNSRSPMPLSVLELPRPAPRLLDEEIEPLLERSDAREAIEDRRNGFLADRHGAVEIVMPHLRRRDAGAAVLALHRYRNGNTRTGLEYARSAYAVCSRGSNLAKDVQPGMTEEAAAALAGAPRGAGIWDERRFWSLVIERLEALQHDEENPSVPRKAKGASDARLQVVSGEHGASIRMSWRGTPGFPGIPLLMLDASAAPAIVRKVWAEREVEVLDVEAPCHLRTVLVTGSTFSDFSMMPGKTNKRRPILAAAKRVRLHRDVVARLAGVHGYGKVLVGGNMGPMAVLRAGWKPPANVDFVHNGAMRGLDGFKNHAAAVLFGRLELPPRAIDAFVAALTYDDDEPELPVDRLGDGMDEDGKPLKPTIGEKIIAMRDGRDIAVEDATYEGAWARLIQGQFREEEVRQFVARLRPVHRLGRAPVAYVACTAIPEGLIVDDVVDVKDLLTPGPDSGQRPFELARETDGVLDARYGGQDREDLVGPRGGIESHLAGARLDKAGFPENQGTTRIRWRLPGGEWSTSSVLTWAENPVAPLAVAIAREQGLTAEEVEEALEFEVLREGVPRAASGTKDPDKIDRSLLGLEPDAPLSHEDARRAYADIEAAERADMIARVKSQLSGLPIGAPESEIEAALLRKRIPQIDWDRLLPYLGADRKTEAVSLAELIIAVRYGLDTADAEEDED